MAEEQPHPYAPRDLQLLGHVPGFLSPSTASPPLSSWCSRGTSLGIHLLKLINRTVSFLAMPEMSCYFAFSPELYKEKTPFYLAEAWKEFSKGDSRYAARDAGVVTVEGLTAVIEGPACL